MHNQSVDKIIQLIDYSSTSSEDEEDHSTNEVAAAVEGGAAASAGEDVLLQEPRVSSSRMTKSESPRQQVRSKGFSHFM